MAMTRSARARRCEVSAPRPGPISITAPPFSGHTASAIRSRIDCRTRKWLPEPPPQSTILGMTLRAWHDTSGLAHYSGGAGISSCASSVVLYYGTSRGDGMPKKEDSAFITRCADMFSAMGAEPRLRIVRLLLSAHPGGPGGGRDWERAKHSREHALASSRTNLRTRTWCGCAARGRFFGTRLIRTHSRIY